MNLFGRSVSVVTGMAFVLLGEIGSAQGLADPSTLVVKNSAQCRDLVGKLGGKESGGQWLIGDAIPLKGQPNAPNEISVLRDAIEAVSCYGQLELGDTEYVFVADSGGNYCGWVERKQLLDEHRRSKLSAFEGNDDVVCRTPRAMPFGRFCAKLKEIGGNVDTICDGVPSTLRAKGVLIGSTQEELVPNFPFYTTPSDGKERESKRFFSILEIHDVAPGGEGRAMALVGDGEGDMFGWVDLAALELWPTRLGLFYDANGQGAMFKRERNLIANWRRKGTPSPDITTGLKVSELMNYVHGPGQLLSYPIIRTIDPAKAAASRSSDTPYHEVIFLGQTGEGSASELMGQAALAREVEALQKLNLMIVMDTTESMRKYLPLVQKGLADFIKSYGQRSSNQTLRLPDVRIAVYAYSDFEKASETDTFDKIRTKELMPPTRIGPGYNVSSYLNRISAHGGLNDAVGLKEEAGLEAVVQLSGKFKNEDWFESGPKAIIHIADHGSRSSVQVDKIAKTLKRSGAYYYPLAVITDNAGNASAVRAGNAFLQQAKRMLAPNIKGSVEDSDVARIDLENYERETPALVRKKLDFLMQEVSSAVASLRADVIGGELAETSRVTQDRAASRFTMDQEILADRGLDKIGDRVIVQASSGFAPFQMYQHGVAQTIDWTYTIALEPTQVRGLQTYFERMCRDVGSPEKSQEMRQLIVKLAAAFSGDKVESDKDVRGILNDMRNLPGADASFLSRSPATLLSIIDSTDPQVISDLKRDVCWTGYHLGNVAAKLYTKPDQLEWRGSEYRVKAGEEAVRREYRYKPVVGAETVYLPSFFFVLPSVVEAKVGEDDSCDFFCN